MTTQPPILKADHLDAGYVSGRNRKIVIRDACLELHPGQIVCLLGANGAGKSTLLRTLSILQPALGGRLEYQGLDATMLDRRERSRFMSVVYTERTHAGALTVRETVGLGRQPYTGFFGRMSQTDRELVKQSLEQVGMSSFADRYVGTLSDGERQKVMMARALAQQTPLMLLDEPTSFLDVASRLEVMALLKNLAETSRKAIILSTHDVANAMAIASHLWLVMPSGEIVSGDKATIADSGLMDNVFSGRNIFFDVSAQDYRIKIGKNTI